MIHLYSGDGKGKTSIVTGLAVRMAGAGKEVLFVQFMKGNESSEVKVLDGLPNVTVRKVEKNFGFYKDMTEKEKGEITKCHNELLLTVQQHIREVSAGKEATTDPELLVVLDEITYPLKWHLIEEGLLMEIFQSLPPWVELAMTGRDPGEVLVEYCDYWSEVSMKKHPYEKGISARKGIEY